MPFVCTLASGSDGNAVLLSNGSTNILIDAGISYIPKALKTFSLTPDDISAVLITHEHSDHICGLSSLKCPIYAAPKTCNSLKTENDLHDISASFEIGRIGIVPFFTQHDTPESLGYLIYLGSLRVAVCTDLGIVTKQVLSNIRMANYLLIECNHDVSMLKNGRYPAFLKKRIFSDNGHLSNEDCAKACVDAASFGVRKITLCHLSKENNSPKIAFETVSNELQRANLHKDVSLDVAPPRICGVPFGSLNL